MPQYDNTNSGAIFRNNKKETDKHPDLTGSLNVDGTDYWVSAWKKQDKNGNPYYSVAVKPKEEAKSGARQPAKASKSTGDDFEDMI